jgi:hypothetical protein
VVAARRTASLFLAVLTAIAVFPAVPVTAQVWTSPRMPDGQPDLQGVWSDASVTPLERPKVLGDRTRC